MMALKFAFKNLMAAGLRTWLNVFVLSLSFVLIIWLQGLYEGMGQFASKAMTEYDIGGGQYWHKNFDPFDPLNMEQMHGTIPAKLQQLINQGQATPQLLHPATIFPHGRLQSVRIRGIDPQQKIVKIPAQALKKAHGLIPALIGQRFAQKLNAKQGDLLTIRWRDANGTFDAVDVEITKIMKTPVPSIDVGQIWLPLSVLQEKLHLENQATLVVLKTPPAQPLTIHDWKFHSRKELLKEIEQLVYTKSVGAMFLYVVLIFLAMIAIFDSQVLSIFHRTKEIGTLIALGLTRWQVAGIFTLEGLITGILAGLVAALYGFPLLYYFKANGFPLPASTDSYGLALGERLYPFYPISLIVGTVVIILLLATLISFLPSRKIARLNPTDALRGKWA